MGHARPFEGRAHCRSLGFAPNEQKIEASRINLDFQSSSHSELAAGESAPRDDKEEAGRHPRVSVSWMGRLQMQQHPTDLHIRLAGFWGSSQQAALIELYRGATCLCQVQGAMNDFRSVWGVGGHFLLCFSGLPPGLAPGRVPTFADFSVHGLKTIFSYAFTTGLHLLTGKEKGGGFPDFLWSLVALASLMRLSLLKAAHVAVASAAYQEIRVAHLVNPCTRKSRTWGTVQGARLVSKRGCVAQPTHDTYLRWGRQTRLFIRSARDCSAPFLYQPSEEKDSP